jgi:sigma-B regulation protein RsbU (phosphoserine phosphatase)
MACAPIKMRGKILGVLQVLNKQDNTAPDFQESDLQLAQAVANHAAIAIDNARHYESLLRVDEHQEMWVTTGLLDSLSLSRG